MHLCVRDICEVFYIFLSKHASYSKVLYKKLHDAAGFLHVRGVRSTGMEYAARHTARECLSGHAVHVGIVDHGEPDTKQQWN